MCTWIPRANFSFYERTPPSHKNNAHKRSRGWGWGCATSSKQLAEAMATNKKETRMCLPYRKVSLNKRPVASLFFLSSLRSAQLGKRKKSGPYMLEKRRGRSGEKSAREKFFHWNTFYVARFFSEQHLAPISSGSAGKYCSLLKCCHVPAPHIFCY